MRVLALGRLVIRIQWEWQEGGAPPGPPPERFLEESREQAMRLLYGSGLPPRGHGNRPQP